MPFKLHSLRHDDLPKLVCSQGQSSLQPSPSTVTRSSSKSGKRKFKSFGQALRIAVVKDRVIRIYIKGFALIEAAKL